MASQFEPLTSSMVKPACESRSALAIVSCTVLNSGMPYTLPSSVTWSRARLHECRRVDALALDAAVERDDGAARGERADLVTVRVDQLGRLPGGDGGEELLQVELALDELHLDVAELALSTSRRDVATSSTPENPMTESVPPAPPRRRTRRRASAAPPVPTAHPPSRSAVAMAAVSAVPVRRMMSSVRAGQGPGSCRNGRYVLVTRRRGLTDRFSGATGLTASGVA